jgi:lipopolysaccharide transport system permease protein
MNDSIDEITIEAGRSDREYWRDLWRYRDLFYFLAWRDILVRYKQAVFGIAWAVMRPLATMFIFTFLFGSIAKLPSSGIPYSIFVLTGMIPWQLFSGSLSEVSNSVVGNASMISKVYFPRLIAPASTIAVNLIDFILSLIILGLLMAWFRVMPPIQIFLLPLFVMLTLFLCLGFGLWLSALSVKYWDFRYIIPFVLQFGLFVSPVAYGSEVIPPKYQLLAQLNPMVGPIDGMRWAILGIHYPHLLSSCLISFGFALSIFISGLYYFRATERTFVDVI